MHSWSNFLYLDDICLMRIALEPIYNTFGLCKDFPGTAIFNTMTSPELHNILFVYDTLRRGQERQGFLSESKSRFLGMATTAGELYTIGDFPGLMVKTSQPGEKLSLENQVTGDLFEIFDPTTFFATLDVIEGYWPDQTERSLFVRQLIPVQTEAGTNTAWAYILNLPVNDLPRFKPLLVTLR